jgi:hypothetical protein
MNSALRLHYREISKSGSQAVVGNPVFQDTRNWLFSEPLTLSKEAQCIAGCGFCMNT